MWAVLSGPGRWQRAGMAGTVTGLDIAACLRLPSLASFDAEVVEELLLAGERGALIGMAKRAKDEADQ